MSDSVQSLARGLAVIRCFDAAHPARTPADVARATGLTRAAARRFLLTLAELGYVRADDRLFSLTPRVLELGWSYLSALTLPQVATPHLERLVAEVRESASVSVLDVSQDKGAEVVYVARVPTRRIMTLSITIGTRFPAWATSMGRVLLAGLPAADRDTARFELSAFTERTVADVDALREVLSTVAEQGYCLVDGELEDGLRSIAVPIRDGGGRVVAAANVSTHVSHHEPGWLEETALPALRACVAAVEADLPRTVRA